MPAEPRATARDPLTYVRNRMAASGSAIYLGEGAGGWVLAGPERSALVLGPPRSGKTSGVVVPSILAAPGPVVSTSTKLDVVAATARARARSGTCWLFDPSGTVRPPSPDLVPLRWSPVVSAGTWDGAVSAAHALVATTRPSLGTTEGSHWSERAESLIAPLLHAAARDGSGIDVVLRWVNRHDAAPAAAILESAGAATASDVLAGILETDRRERSGIFSTASGALSAYRSASAVSAALEPNFDPDDFVGGTSTVYVCTAAHEQAALAPLVVGLVEAIRASVAVRARNAGPALLLALDEVANIAPIPSLPTIVSEGGSQGVVSLACIQDLSQARARWGAAADGFLTLFSSTLVLPGLADLRTLELVSALAGRTGGPERSTTRRRWLGGSVTTAVTSRARLPVDQVARGRPGHALLLAGGASPAWVMLTPWFARSPWREAAAQEKRQADLDRAHHDRGPERLGDDRAHGQRFRSAGRDGAGRGGAAR